MGKPLLIDELVRAALSIAQNGIGRKGAPETFLQAAAIDSDDLRQRSRAFVSGENMLCLCVRGVFYEAGDAAPGTRHQIFRKRSQCWQQRYGMSKAALRITRPRPTIAKSQQPNALNLRGRRSHLLQTRGLFGCACRALGAQWFDLDRTFSALQLQNRAWKNSCCGP